MYERTVGNEHTLNLTQAAEALRGWHLHDCNHQHASNEEGKPVSSWNLKVGTLHSNAGVVSEMQWCVCICVGRRVHVGVRMRVWTWVGVWAWACICVHAWVCMCGHAYVCVSMGGCMCMGVCCIVG